MQFTIASRPCVCCGSSRQKPYGQLPRGQYLRCTDCGLICQDGSVPYEETQAGYERANPEWDVDRFDELPHRLRQAPQAIFDSVTCYKTEPCSVLDIGCYRGFLLKYFQSRGWMDVVGIEPSKSACAFAIERIEIDVFGGYLEDYIAS